MKITKKDASISTSTNKYDKSLTHIRAAIDALGEVALSDREDVLARESIANLSVVLLDLEN